MITISDLVDSYLTDKHSSHHGHSYRVRLNNERYLARIKRDRGQYKIRDVQQRTLTYWYKGWTIDGKLASGRVFLSQLRALFLHGTDSSADADCYRLLRALDNLAVAPLSPRHSSLTHKDVEAVMKQAHLMGWPSLALGQAFQFELWLKQKDVIGEWLPADEIGEQTRIDWRGKSWVRGLRWEEIDSQFVLNHRTTGREREIDADLKRAPLIMRELENWPFRLASGPLVREDFPSSGPVIVCEITAMPWAASEYRRKWRLLADGVGISKAVRNLDSRVGARYVKIAGRYFRTFDRPRPHPESKSKYATSHFVGVKNSP